MLAGKFQEAYSEKEYDDPAGCYHSALEWLWAKSSAKDLTRGEASATLDWLLDKEAPEGVYDLHPAVLEEAVRILHQAMKDAGQSDMFDESEDDKEGDE